MNNLKLEERTLKIIDRGGRILLKRADGWYLGQWTNIAAGRDGSRWGTKRRALEISDLEWAFALAKLYGCKVVSTFPSKKKEVPTAVQESIGDLIKRKLAEQEKQPKCPSCNPGSWADRGECTCGRQGQLFVTINDDVDFNSASAGGDPVYTRKR